MLIRNAGHPGRPPLDIRCADSAIVEMDQNLRPREHEDELDAAGGWVMPGLHDHHLHLRALAATTESVHLGPPTIRDRTGSVS